MITIEYFPNKKVNISDNFIKLLISMFFITTFVSREISNLIIILILVISLAFLATNKIKLSKVDKILVSLIFSFTLLILITAFIHASPISEVDTYLRVIILFPIYLLMKEIRFSEREISWLFLLCIISSLILYFVNGSNLYHDNRYSGSSSVVLTYSNMIMTIILYLILMLTQKKIKLIIKLIMLSAAIFLLLETNTKGPLLSFLLCIPFIIYLDRKLFTPIILVITVSSMLIYFSPLSSRISSFVESISTIDSKNITNSTSKNFSENERIYYYFFSVTQILDNPLMGIGPGNYEETIKKQIESDNLNITVSDHAHNDFLDISVKFGIITTSMFISILIYFFIIFLKSQNSYISRCGIITIVSQVGYMLTQSQFAHNQAIVFFFFLLYLFLSQISELNKKNNYIEDN